MAPNHNFFACSAVIFCPSLGELFSQLSSSAYILSMLSYIFWFKPRQTSLSSFKLSIHTDSLPISACSFTEHAQPHFLFQQTMLIFSLPSSAYLQLFLQNSECSALSFKLVKLFLYLCIHTITFSFFSLLVKIVLSLVILFQELILFEHLELQITKNQKQLFNGQVILWQ